MIFEKLETIRKEVKTFEKIRSKFELGVRKSIVAYPDLLGHLANEAEIVGDEDLCSPSDRRTSFQPKMYRFSKRQKQL